MRLSFPRSLAWLFPALFTLWLGPESTNGEEIRFVDRTEGSGLREGLRGIMGHGGAVGDIDGDGHPDYYVGGFADRPNEEYTPLSAPPTNRLLKNRGDGTFEILDQPAVEIYARTSGAVFADLDNDGDLDLYCANNAKGSSKREMEPQRSATTNRSKLFRNDGGTFVDVSEESGACPESVLTARNVGVFDYDLDGRLDLFVVEDRFTKDSGSVLLRNLGDLQFEVVNEKVGIPDGVFGLGMAVADLNADGRPDFFVGHSNRLFLSRENGTYHEDEALNELFAWEPLDGEDWPCGAAFADLNRDGRLDLILSIHFREARNRIFLNEGVKDGVPQFRDITPETGLPAAEAEKSPHVEVQDFDNDGWPDLYFSTAKLREDGTAIPLVYRHTGLADGVPQFEPISAWKEEGDLVYYPAGPTCDVDGDGRIDLLPINWFRGNHSRLLQNETETRNSWLRISVRGKTFNQQGIGTLIEVFADGERVGCQEITTGYGYASGQEAKAHFGLGETSTVDLKIRFPDGTKREVKAVTELDREMVLEE